MNRRSLLKAAVVSATALVAGTARGASSFATAPAPMRYRGASALSPVLLPLFANDVFNGEALFALGAASSGTGEIGEVLRMAQVINARTGNLENPEQADFDAYVDTFGAYGSALARRARRSGNAHPVSARQQNLRAAMYAAQQLFFVLGTSEPDREERLFESAQRRWLAAVRLIDPPVQEFAVNTAFGRVPCYFFPSPAGQGARPTVIISEGSDGQNVETMQFGATAALDRGYNVVLFEGPGQMSLLFRRQIPFTPNWNRIIGPIVSRIRRRDDVGPIALVGISFGGMLCSRAAARLTSLDAVVLQPAAWDMTLLWGDQESMNTVKQTHNLPPAEKERVRAEVNAGFRAAWESGEIPYVNKFEINKRGEIFSREVLREARAGAIISDYYALLEAQLSFQFENDYRLITMPTLVTSNEGDTSFGDQSRQAYDFLENVPSSRKAYVRLTAAQGASLHDQPVGPQVAQEYVFDWLDEQLG
jgi:pimeloyl-ACP methyl ester carboxylesterase